MIAISNNYKTVNETTVTPQTSFRDRRPVIGMYADDFMNLLIENGNVILKKRGISKNFIIKENDLELMDQLFFYAICDPKSKMDLNKGLFIMGSYGTGKTLLMEAFLELFNQDEHSKRVTMMESNEIVRNALANNDFIDSIKMKPLLIDDLGKESKSIKSYGSEIEPIRELLSLRYRYGGFTCITSNYNLDTISDFYGEHIADRLKEMCNIIIMTGESLR